MVFCSPKGLGMDYEKEKALKLKYGAPLRVLALEDNLIDRSILESMLLKSKDYTSFIRITDKFEEAEEFLRTFVFDVVILDLNLTDRLGIDTLIELRQKFADIPIVVNTGAFENEIGLEALNYGAQDFLVKGDYTARILNKVLHYAVERKRLEVQLAEARKRFLDAQSQLIQSEKMEVIGQLASGIAHEVKNPLGTIAYGITYLINHIKDRNDLIDKVFDNIQESIDRANLIITDLLDFSSLTKLNMREICLKELVVKSLLLTKYEQEKKNVVVETEFENDAPKVIVDGNRIQQVLINVLINAISAVSKNGTIRICVKKCGFLENSSLEFEKNKHFNKSDMFVLLTIEDDGNGIPEEKIEKVFEPFYTTKRANGGVGLGLSVSRQIMDLHKGLLRIENRHERGVKATMVFKA